VRGIGDFVTVQSHEGTDVREVDTEKLITLKGTLTDTPKRHMYYYVNYPKLARLAKTDVN
jgi:hypothetical protein